MRTSPLMSSGRRRNVRRERKVSRMRRVVRGSHVHKQRKKHVCPASAQSPSSTTPRSNVLLVDNYDSFTYNLSQYLAQLGCEHRVVKNDELSVDEVVALAPLGVLISPGPGTPEDSGISLALVEALCATTPIFGVCMGHQCIGQAFGGKIVRAPMGLMHGKSSLVTHTGVGVLKGLDDPFRAARYHSLVIDSRSGENGEDDVFPHDELEVTAWCDDGVVMGVRHKKFPHVQGVQFHPESIITDNGLAIVQNWIDQCHEFHNTQASEAETPAPAASS